MPEPIDPYGGEIVDLVAREEEATTLEAEAARLPTLTLSDTALCDLELLATGGFFPLRGFMCSDDYRRVVGEMRLGDGTLWPLPITLEVSQDFQGPPGSRAALCDRKGVILAVMNIEDAFEADLDAEARHIYAGNEEHPTLRRLRTGSVRRLGGPVRVIQLPVHHDFKSLRLPPAQVRKEMTSRGWDRMVAFQTRNPLHRAHEELTKRAAKEVGGGLLIHPVVGVTKPGDVDHYTRVRCYQALVENHYKPNEVILSLLPLAMRLAGPREALWHAIIRRNHGATHFIVGRDHAGPGNDSGGKPFYGPYDAQELLAEHETEIGVKMVPFQMVVYLPKKDRYVPVDEVPNGEETASISGTQVREEYLAKGKPLPEWFTRPEVARLLGEAYPPKKKQGLCIWLTGLSAAGKSTIAEILAQRLLEYGRPSTVLDGDVVRKNLSKGLGFSKEDRDTNIRRIGFVAAEIARHGGTVICAAISPYRAIRQENRELIRNYVEVFVDAPLEVCEARDRKGLYKKARAGEIKGFTGIDDPYEPPTENFTACHTDRETPEESVEKVLSHLSTAGYL